MEGGPDIFICFSSQNVKLGMLSWEDLGGLEKGLLISFSFDCWSSHTILSCHGTRPASLLKYSTMQSLRALPALLAVFPLHPCTTSGDIWGSFLHAPGITSWVSGSSRSKSPMILVLSLIKLCRMQQARTMVFTRSGV